MKATYNLIGVARRNLVKAIENIIGEKAVYKKLHRYEVTFEICPEHDRLPGTGPKTSRSGDRGLLRKREPGYRVDGVGAHALDHEQPCRERVSFHFRE